MIKSAVKSAVKSRENVSCCGSSLYFFVVVYLPVVYVRRFDILSPCILYSRLMPNREQEPEPTVYRGEHFEAELSETDTTFSVQVTDGASELIVPLIV